MSKFEITIINYQNELTIDMYLTNDYDCHYIGTVHNIDKYTIEKSDNYYHIRYYQNNNEIGSSLFVDNYRKVNC